MNRIFVDLEMHPVAPEYVQERAIFKFETIEVGAVMLDERYEEIASFCEYVKPLYSEKILPRYEELTGITTQMVAEADALPEVLERFADWCGEGYTMYSWSKADLNQIRGECRLKGIKPDEKLTYMLRHWQDFQKEFSRLVGIHHPIKLEEAVGLGGLDFDGRAHDGLVDARNTANLYRQSRDEQMFKKLKSMISEKENPLVFSMSDVFNFDNLKLEED